MSIKHAFTVICENIIVSQHKRVSFIDAFTNVKVRSLPGPLPRFCVAVGFHGEEGDEYIVELVGPPGDEHRVMEIAKGAIDKSSAVDSTTGPVSMSLALAEYQPLFFTASGIHHIVFRSPKQKKPIHRQPFSVLVIDTEKEGDDATNQQSESQMVKPGK